MFVIDFKTGNYTTQTVAYQIKQCRLKASDGIRKAFAPMRAEMFFIGGLHPYFSGWEGGGIFC
ncbi:hypothetical protein [Neisseria viridiae]|uniref:hypothetical protein n=1 Tax=Neisseria viridiae TaxID=2830648 RepID=UPI00272ACE6E|nr:hypothetical protein [Neisseria viridiae]